MTRTDVLTLSTVINAAVAEHGALRVLVATVGATLRPTAMRSDIPDLPDYLRKDVGLPDTVRRTPFPELFR